MRLDIKTLVIVSTGAFFYWALTGFKGKFNDRMSRYYDDDAKYYKNFVTGLIVLVVLFLLVYRILLFFF